MFLINKYSIMCRRHKLSMKKSTVYFSITKWRKKTDTARSLGTLNDSPLLLTKACRRYATMDKNILGDVTIRNFLNPLRARLSETLYVKLIELPHISMWGY